MPSVVHSHPSFTILLLLEKTDGRAVTYPLCRVGRGGVCAYFFSLIQTPISEQKTSENITTPHTQHYLTTHHTPHPIIRHHIPSPYTTPPSSHTTHCTPLLHTAPPSPYTTHHTLGCRLRETANMISLPSKVRVYSQSQPCEGVAWLSLLYRKILWILVQIEHF